MFQKMGDEVRSAEITEEQLSHLNLLAPNDQMTAAHIFADAYGPMWPAHQVRGHDDGNFEE